MFPVFRNLLSNLLFRFAAATAHADTSGGDENYDQSDNEYASFNIV